MKTRIMKIILIIQFAVIVLVLMWIFIQIKGARNKTELLREVSPDGDYVLLIEEEGSKPTFLLFPIDRIRVTLYENVSMQERHGTSFCASVRTGGGTADYEIEWLEDGVQVILSGIKSQYYILPFKTFEDLKAVAAPCTNSDVTGI